MSPSSTTRPSLLLRIRHADDKTAWHEFFEIYAPLIHSYARYLGLQDADALDLTQEVLQTIAAKASHFDYDPGRGSFRGWLRTVTRNKLRDLADRRQRQPAATGDSGFQAVLREQADPQSDEHIWNQHHQWHLFLWAAQKVRVDFRPSTWEAFWNVTVENQPVRQVAQQLGVSVGAVHIAKSRVLARLREQLRTIEE